MADNEHEVISIIRTIRDLWAQLAGCCGPGTDEQRIFTAKQNETQAMLNVFLKVAKREAANGG